MLPINGENGHDSKRGGGGDDAAGGEGADLSPRGVGEEASTTAATAIEALPIQGDKERLRLYPKGSWRREVDSSRDVDWRKSSARDYARVLHSASFRRLGGKTQVFPVHESDFFRTRLTHSLEVAQIAEGIAQKINGSPPFKADPIDEKLCATAALIHDLGHPPFGHNGERALDDCMREFGGFEGNAQTLRIVARLEKKFRKEAGGEGYESDDRAGLALTYRTLLSALKYDHEIASVRDEKRKLEKGYYHTEREIVKRAKASVDPKWQARKNFKTIECAIMDIADDIAYSTYDLEDTLKAEFLTPADILCADNVLFEAVAAEANKALTKRGEKIDGKDALNVFADIFFPEAYGPPRELTVENLISVYAGFKKFSESGYDRTALSSSLIHEAICGVNVDYNKDAPWLSEVSLSTEVLKRVEVLKHFTFQATIYSARVKVGEYRGYQVVSNIFKALAHPNGVLLMPDDLRRRYRECETDATARYRAICDFVAGMTDRYALEFHARLNSDDPQSIFKPI